MQMNLSNVSRFINLKILYKYLAETTTTFTTTTTTPPPACTISCQAHCTLIEDTGNGECGCECATTTTTTTLEDCPCTDAVNDQIFAGFSPFFAKFGQIKGYAAGQDTFVFAMAQTIHDLDKVPGMPDGGHDGY